MAGLLDVNVLIALAWPNHIHHASALRWFRAHSSAGWATCSLTQTGFVRVSSNRAALPDARSPQEAAALLQQITALPRHVFWKDDVPCGDARFVAIEKVLGHQQVTDAHLLALAIRHRGRLVTFDGRVRALVPDGRDPDKVVEVIDAG